MSDPVSPQGADLQESVSENIGGVQGGDHSEAGDQVAQSTPPGAPADEPAPDGAEIEWAGGVVKKPPAPTGRSER